MNYLQQRKKERFVFFLLKIIGFGCIACCCGLYLGANFEINAEAKATYESIRPLLALYALCLGVYSLAAICIAYNINICLHEIGHLIFGLMTGYQFVSLRLGPMIIMKVKGKLRLYRTGVLLGGGACEMASSKKDAEHMPVVLFNLGGLIMNFVVFLIGIAVFLQMKNLISGSIVLVLSMTSLLMIILNGIPLPQLGNDGSRAVILCKDTNAREAYSNLLKITKYTTDNYSIREMPAELFSFDKSIPMTNQIITAQAVNQFQYFLEHRMYTEAKEMASFILENTTNIIADQEIQLRSETLFIAIVIDQDKESAKKQFGLHENSLMQTTHYLSTLRVLYAYYSLVEVNLEKATKYAKIHESIFKSIVYPKVAEMEMEKIILLTDLLQSVAGKTE
ncbi:MAG TPA: M50 family metallopeptidase [Bacillota bacterium]|nr:M50 family metallopeptidase [Bacillota bacterium]